MMFDGFDLIAPAELTIVPVTVNGSPGITAALLWKYEVSVLPFICCCTCPIDVKAKASLNQLK